MATLYEIDANMQALDALLEETEGDVTGNEEAIEKWFQENEKDLLDKLDGYGMVIKNHEMLAKAQKEEKQRFDKLKSTNEKIVQRLKDRLCSFLYLRKPDEIIRGTKFTWWTQANPGEDPLLVSDEARADPVAVLPEKYVIKTQVPEVIIPACETITINEELLRADLLNGTDEEKKALEGLAKIGDKGRHLRMK